MQPLIWEHRPDSLRAPALVCAFTGWNDAGDAASSALAFLGASLGATRFAQIDPEEFYDFQSVRPKVKLIDGDTREIVWPAARSSPPACRERRAIWCCSAVPSRRCAGAASRR
jgi:hypothetical protein